ncbi:hypothetical protein C9374_004299 [Naegleria lovaniensis]|uniref:Proteasome assembly chaperone 2 n=1 Tax=Naegleria lovaniensis TaxID=51637 RepID=A0AA88KKZ3_NAELO|nr:uncharacterized protein C9374_004299 [Naegleria lovaniensis]KAG2383628.1 hypothetical protein C9374_004299 [Naegleria lovaniensis]
MKFFPCISSEGLSESEIKNLLHNAEMCMISIPSIGNVGQLAMDFIISSYSEKAFSKINKLGYLETGFLLSCVGNDPYFAPSETHHGKLHSALEVYSLQFYQNDQPVGANIILIHCRSIVIYPTLFVRDLNEWISKGNDDDGDYFLKNLQTLISLSSANAGLQDDRFIQRIQESPMEFGLASLAFDANLTNDSQFPLTSFLTTIPRIDKATYPLFFSAVNSKLLENDETSQGENNGTVRKLNRVIVFMICNEGENSIHGISLCKAVTGEILLPYLKRTNINSTPLDHFNSMEWKAPYSWRYFYGPPVNDINLYN